MKDAVALVAGLAAIWWLLRRRTGLGWCLLAGAVVVGTCAGPGIPRLAKAAAGELAGRSSLELMAAVALVGIMGHVLQETGALGQMVDGLRAILRWREGVLVLAPAIIGLLIIPGGAIISAPLVEEGGRPLGLSAEQKAAVNVLFRHSLHLVFPLYPALVMFCALTGIAVYSLVLLQVPMMVVGIVLGYLCCFGPRWHRAAGGRNEPEDGARVFGRASLPLVVAIAAAGTGRVPFPLALVLGIALAAVLQRVGRRELVAMVREGFSGELVLVVVGMVALRTALDASGLLGRLVQGTAQLGIPHRLLLSGVPALASLLTGNALASVAISTPVLLGVIPSSALTPGALALAFTASTIGYIAGPVHLCLVLTREYFRADVGGVYRLVVPPLVVVMLTALGVSFLA